MKVPLWLGAPAPGRLALPPAGPTPSHLYAPRGVHLDGELLAVADTGNHRVLLWHGPPRQDGAPADVVLGQPDAWSDGPLASGRGPRNGFRLPVGVAAIAGRLWVADAWNHRILVWNEIPRASDTPPDFALGQDGLGGVEAQRGGAISLAGLSSPSGLAQAGGWLYVADTGNRRVLAWRGLPEGDRPADRVLGQPDGASGEENRGGPVSGRSFRWPHALAGGGGRLYVADAGNHRVLGWSRAPEAGPPPEEGGADLVLGQPDFATAFEMPHRPQGAKSLRFPYGLALEGGTLAVADTANNRVLLWNRPPAGPEAAADAVLGQPDFAASGENRWQGVERDTLCWPYALSLHRGRLAIADSGNNRVVVWDLAAASSGR